jgi:hypothetical protein
MNSYDYTAIIREHCKALPEVVGKVLTKALVQVVEPEFNAFYLVLADSTYAISGRIGAEVIGIQRMDMSPIQGENSFITVTKPFKIFDLFLGRRITQARMIGEAWNGHGFEFSFEGLPNRTMIVQSIYAGTENEQELHDCLRLERFNKNYSHTR